MQCLTIFSLLLEYPNELLWQNKTILQTTVMESNNLNDRQKTTLNSFISHYLEHNLLESQAEYSATFDLGSRFSLLLFEHLHGDSRERGQAMVDLITDYRHAGFELSVNQLPDYLPLCLEFLSHQTLDVSQSWLNRIGPVLRLLSLRLAAQHSLYATLFELLFELSQCDWDDSTMKEAIKKEQDDRTPEALDTLWQEEQILFSSQSAGKKRTSL